MLNKLEKKVNYLIEIIEWGNTQDLQLWLVDFANFLNTNQTLFDDYLNWLKIDVGKDYDIPESNSYKIHNLYLDKFDDVYKYQALHTSEIYEWLVKISFLFSSHKNEDDAKYEILFELYKHLLPNHIDILVKTFENNKI